MEIFVYPARLRPKITEEPDMSTISIPALAAARTAVITGGAGGIGLAAAKRLAEASRGGEAVRAGHRCG